MKNLLGWIIVGWVVLCTSVGCISTKSYVDPIYAKANYEDITRLERPYKLYVVTEFQREGKHIAKLDKELRGHVERVLRGTGFAVPAQEEGEGDLTIVVNNFGDKGSAMAKGFGTGLTFGLVGSMVTDYYEMKASLVIGGKLVKQQTYKHALHSTIGNADGPQGVKATTPSGGFGDIVEDLMLNFIKDIQISKEIIPVS